MSDSTTLDQINGYAQQVVAAYDAMLLAPTDDAWTVANTRFDCARLLLAHAREGGADLRVVAEFLTLPRPPRPSRRK